MDSKTASSNSGRINRFEIIKLIILLLLITSSVIVIIFLNLNYQESFLSGLEDEIEVINSEE